MFVAPSAVCGLRLLTECVVTPAEDHYELCIWILLLEQQHLLTICGGKLSLSFQDYGRIVIKGKVGEVPSLLFRHEVRERLRLVLMFDSCLVQKRGKSYL